MGKSFSKLAKLFALCLMVGSSVHAQPQPTIGDEPVEAFKNKAVDITFSALPEVAPASNQELINGIPVDVRFFPTIYRMATGGTCTAALIGEAALLTAAHCVPDGALIRFVIGNRVIRGLCEQAPGYHPQFNRSEDWVSFLKIDPSATS